jgi:hypothetical protein
MTRPQVRKKPGGRADLLERAELAKQGAYKLDARDGCDGQHDHPPELARAIHVGSYVAGVNLYCDGEASARGATGWTHDRVDVARFRHFTCLRIRDHITDPQDQQYGDRWWSWWMKPNQDGSLPERIDSTVERPLVRLECPHLPCTFARDLNAGRVERLMSEVWSEHAVRVEPRNVATLLV